MPKESHSDFFRSDETIQYTTWQSDSEFKIFESDESEAVLRVRTSNGTDIRQKSRAPLDEITDTNTGDIKGFLYGQSDQSELYITDQRLVLVVSKPSKEQLIEFSYDEDVIQLDQTSRARYNYIVADGITYSFQIWPNNHYDAEEYMADRIKCKQVERRALDSATLYSAQKIPDDTVKNRISNVVSNKYIPAELEEICQDSQSAKRWLNVWARWESLHTIEDTPRSEVPVDAMNIVGDSLATNLRNQGYKNLNDIRDETAEGLKEVDSVGEKRSNNLYDYVCYRPVENIEKISTTTALRMNLQGLATAADISAISTKALTDIKGINQQRATNLQAHAAAWLPESSGLPPKIMNHYEPPFEDLKIAESKLDEVESLIHHDCGSEVFYLAEKLTDDSEKISREMVYNRCFNEDQEEYIVDGTKQAIRWIDVLQQLAVLAEGSQTPQCPAQIIDTFDLAPLNTVTIKPSTIISLPLQEAAEHVYEVEAIVAAQSKFVRAVLQAETLLKRADKFDLSGQVQLEAGITSQIDAAQVALENGDGTELADTLLWYVFVCDDAINAVKTYPEHPFSKIVTALGALADEEGDIMDELTKYHRIIDISKQAIDKIHNTPYDHPSIDQGFWIENINIALKQQYQPAIEPIAEQIERLQGGLWETSDLYEVDWREFENLIGDLYRDDGFDVDVTQSSADLGVDVWARDGEENMAIQIKHFQTDQTVGREVLQKLVSTLAKGDADKAIVVTSSEFADTAQRYAADFGEDLELINGDELVQRLSESSIPP